MIRKTRLIFLGAVAGAGLTLLATQPHSVFVGSSAKAASSDTYRQLDLFGAAFERVRADYVEKPDDSKLVESAINGMLAGLDPHSSYMDLKSFRDIGVQTRGEFGGLGIEVTMEDGLVKVVAPIDDTPAAKAGVHHHQTRRRAGPWADARSGGREDARPGEHQDQAHHHAQRF
jgi:carboxyl-terminal processing protease